MLDCKQTLLSVLLLVLVSVVVSVLAKDKPIPNKAIHTLDRDMPKYDYTPAVEELRRRILIDINANPSLYAEKDVIKCKQDDWFLARFLFRHKMNMNKAHKQLKETLMYLKESFYALAKPEDFPAEFYKVGGVFTYEPDRRNNTVMIMRVKVHRITREIQWVIESFLLFHLMQADEAARMRGIAVVIDCTSGSLKNADMVLLKSFIKHLIRYYPKGLSYVLVYNLPWILKPFWHMAKNWIPDEHRELIKFADGKGIYKYIAKENLPDFLGGTCKRDYRQAPANSKNIKDAIKFWGVDVKMARPIFKKFRPELPEDAAKNLDRILDELDKEVYEKKEFPTSRNNKITEQWLGKKL